MPLQRLTLDRMSCFVIGFSLLGTTEYPQTPLAPCGLVGIAIPILLIQQDTRAFLISQQAIPYRHVVAHVVIGCLLLRFGP
jgi:hypothetical protein